MTHLVLGPVSAPHECFDTRALSVAVLPHAKLGCRFCSAAKRPSAMSGVLSIPVLDDHADRALTPKLSRLARMPLHKILCFLPGNGASVVIILAHIHDEVNDIVVQGTNVGRYVCVDVAMFPACKLDDVSAKNKRMCERSPLMPTYDPSIEYVTLSKTHLTFALL